MKQEFLQVLMSWAVSISGYEMPNEMPDVFYVEHEWIVNNACFGRDGKKCSQVGAWYNDEGIVYVDVKFHGDLHGPNSGMIVHELTHFLQDRSGQFEGTCEEFIEREREAFWIQYQYLQRVYGTLEPMHQNYMACRK